VAVYEESNVPILGEDAGPDELPRPLRDLYERVSWLIGRVYEAALGREEWTANRDAPAFVVGQVSKARHLRVHFFRPTGSATIATVREDLRGVFPVGWRVDVTACIVVTGASSSRA
jgi:hypothetical protein